MVCVFLIICQNFVLRWSMQWTTILNQTTMFTLQEIVKPSWCPSTGTFLISRYKVTIRMPEYLKNMMSRHCLWRVFGLCLSCFSEILVWFLVVIWKPHHSTTKVFLPFEYQMVTVCISFFLTSILFDRLFIHFPSFYVQLFLYYLFLNFSFVFAPSFLFVTAIEI